MQIIKSIADVEKFAGSINPHTISIGSIIVKKTDLKFVICPCFLDNTLDRYIIRASLAKSDV